MGSPAREAGARLARAGLARWRRDGPGRWLVQEVSVIRRRQVGSEQPERRLRRNEQIRASQVRLIGDEGQQLGVVWLREAIDYAREQGLDLIEVAPEANPPVCRVMDWGRYRYEQQRREREQRKKQRSLEVKSLRLRPATDDHDFGVTCRKADNFLRAGHKVRVEVRFKGREITHQELGLAILRRLAEALAEVSDVEQRPAMEGRRMIQILNPKPEAVAARKAAEEAAAARGEALPELEPDDSDELDEDDELDDSVDVTPDSSGEDEPVGDAASDDAEVEAAASAQEDEETATDAA